MSRRHDNLSFSHHLEVAPLEPEEQDAILSEAAPEPGETKPRLSTLYKRFVHSPRTRRDTLVECRHAGYVTGVVDAERERVTIQEAARRLGVSESAIRKRVQRGTLQHQRDPDGRVYVYLDMGETGEDAVRDASRDELVDTLRDTVRDLRERLDKEQEANRENRRIIAGLLERVPELEPSPSPEPRGGAETGAGASGGTDIPETYTKPQTAAQAPEGTARRPWWLRLIGR